MNEDVIWAMKILIGIVIVLGSLVHWTNSILNERTVFVTQVSEYENRIFIYSYDDQIGFTRWPYGGTMDQLRIIEPGNTYRIVFTGYRVISVEKVI